MRWALVVYGILNGILYASLTPLWEGFDEPQHYAYVQWLAHGCGLPVLNRTPLTGEVWSAVALAPAGNVVKEGWPQVKSYSEWFALEPLERARLRAELESVHGATPCASDSTQNYEVQQAPLAYAILAAPEWLLRSTPLFTRVWLLRLVCAIASSVAVTLGLFRLARQLKLPEPYAAGAAFLILSTQIFYAATAHVANDWLAVALGVLLANLAVDAWQRPGRRTAALLGLALGTGLLTKAYFLGFVPFAIGVVACLAWRRKLGWRGMVSFAGVLLLIAGPWYARNVALYGSLSGQEATMRNVTPGDLLATAWRMPWFDSIAASARACLWTGNHSFATFSRTTIGLMLALLVAAAILYLWSARRQRPSAAEWVAASGTACFLAAMGYSAVVNNWVTKGEANIPGPWYSPVVLPILYALLFLGLARTRLTGRLVATAALAVWAYQISATYVAKLIPMYTGYTGRVRLIALVRWYTGSPAALREALDDTAMRGAGFVLGLTAIVVLMAIVLAVFVSQRLKTNPVE